MAPGTALNEAGSAAGCASAAGFIRRLPAAIPMTTPTPNDKTIIAVLLIAVLPRYPPERDRRMGKRAGESQLQGARPCSSARFSSWGPTGTAAPTPQQPSNRRQTDQGIRG